MHAHAAEGAVADALAGGVARSRGDEVLLQRGEVDRGGRGLELGLRSSRSWVSCSFFSGSAVGEFDGDRVEPLLDGVGRALAAPLRLVGLDRFGDRAVRLVLEPALRRSAALCSSDIVRVFFFAAIAPANHVPSGSFQVASIRFIAGILSVLFPRSHCRKSDVLFKIACQALQSAGILAPSVRRSSSWVPCSTTRPRSITTTRSAVAAWLRRCAITKAVRSARHCCGPDVEHVGPGAARLGGGLVEHHDRGVGQQDAGEGEQLVSLAVRRHSMYPAVGVAIRSPPAAVEGGICSLFG